MAFYRRSYRYRGRRGSSLRSRLRGALRKIRRQKAVLRKLPSRRFGWKRR